MRPGKITFSFKKSSSWVCKEARLQLLRVIGKRRAHDPGNWQQQHRKSDNDRSWLGRARFSDGAWKLFKGPKTIKLSRRGTRFGREVFVGYEKLVDKTLVESKFSQYHFYGDFSETSFRCFKRQRKRHGRNHNAAQAKVQFCGQGKKAFESRRKTVADVREKTVSFAGKEKTKQEKRKRHRDSGAGDEQPASHQKRLRHRDGRRKLHGDTRWKVRALPAKLLQLHGQLLILLFLLRLQKQGEFLRAAVRAAVPGGEEKAANRFSCQVPGSERNFRETASVFVAARKLAPDIDVFLS